MPSPDRARRIRPFEFEVTARFNGGASLVTLPNVPADNVFDAMAQTGETMAALGWFRLSLVHSVHFRKVKARRP